VTLVHLVRHAPHRLQGEVLVGRMPGVGLSGEGLAMAGALAAKMRAAGPIDSILTSPLERARDTAAAIGRVFGCAPAIEPALDEIDFGRWTGAPFADLAHDPAWQAWNAARSTSRPPEGESMGAARTRIVGLIEALAQRHPEGSLVLVSHQDVLRAAILRALGLGLDAYDRIALDPASWSTLEIYPGYCRLRLLNATPRLRG
jgi:broad specificity phosphatase PhoE